MEEQLYSISRTNGVLTVFENDKPILSARGTYEDEVALQKLIDTANAAKCSKHKLFPTYNPKGDMNL